eukprot:scaffold434_cov186-Pinguiococcus_pyrenoidosus.AAC.18
MAGHGCPRDRGQRRGRRGQQPRAPRAARGAAARRHERPGRALRRGWAATSLPCGTKFGAKMTTVLRRCNLLPYIKIPRAPPTQSHVHGNAARQASRVVRDLRLFTRVCVARGAQPALTTSS